MWSKVLPLEEHGHASPFQFQNLGKSSPASAGAVPRQMSGNEEERELSQLRARVLELEHGLPQKLTLSRQAGFQEGQNSGRSQAEAALKPVFDRLGKSVQDLAEVKPRLRKELEEDAVKLALAIAKRILRREMHVDAAALKALVQVAFEKMERNEIARVIVHPDHVTSVQETLGTLTARKIEILGDSSREKGTLIFETNRGAVDASVDSQLGEIEFGLADRLRWR